MLDGGQNQTTGINFAPAAPLQKLGDMDRPYEESSFNEFCRDLHIEHKDRNLNERREIHEVGRLIANCRSGKLILDRDPKFGHHVLLKPLSHKPRQDAHVYPLFQTNSSQLTSVWSLSQPRVIPRHFGNTNKAQIQHGYIQKVIDHYSEEWFDEWFNQNESLSAMDYGTIILDPCYDDKLNRITRLQPVVEDVNETVFEGYAFCRAPGCGREGLPEEFQKTADSMPQCPECGSYNTNDIVPAQSVMASKVTGQQEISQGDIRITLESVPALNWDMRKLVQESSYVHRAFEISKRLVESILGVEINEEDPNEDIGLRVINEIGSRGGSTQGLGRDDLYGSYSNMKGVTLGYEEWYRPEVYMGTRFRKDEKTVSGQVIPKGVPLEKFFPDGLYLIGFNDMSVVIGAYNERCKIKSTVYHIQSHSGVGKGVADAVDVSEQLNSAHSASLAVIKRYGAGGGHVYNSNVISFNEAKKILKPGGLVGAAMGRTNNINLDAVMKQIQTGELNQSNMLMIAQLINMINMAFQTTDFTTGVADNRVDVNTLGGQQMLQAQQVQRSASPLRMKGYLRAETLEEVVDIFRHNIKIPMWFAVADRFAMTKGRYISGEDIPQRIKCVFVKDSELPTNTLTKRDNTERMLEKSGLTLDAFAMASQSMPRIFAWWVERFEAELPIFNYDEILMRCQDRLDQIKRIAGEEEQLMELSGMYTDPAMAAQGVLSKLLPSVELFEENHVIKAQVLSEYLDDDEVAEWSPLMKASVQGLISLHYQLDSQFRWSLQALEAQGEIGIQTMAANAQQQLMAGPQAAQQEQELLMAGAEKVAGEIEKEEDFERSEESAEKADQRSEASAEKAHTRALQLKKLELKSKPKPAAKKEKK